MCKKREGEKMTKRLTMIFALLSLTFLLIIGCSGKRGPQGEAGITECMQCHADDSVIRAINVEWQNSIHASGNNIDRNTPPCSRCHTGEGFIDYVSTGVPDTIDMPGLITCFSCHRPHENRNFNLRTMTAVSLENGGIFDRGTGNLCANCHMARLLSPAIPSTPDGTVNITSTRWGPHHGTQADVLSGQNAYVFPGSTYANSPHTTAVTNGCPTCHMATPIGNKAGGHTMIMTYDGGQLLTGCKQSGCHAGVSGFDFDYLGYQDSVAAKLNALETVLVADSLLNSDLLFNAPKTVTGIQAGAVYNYFLFKEDRSLGVHNTQYTLDALNASISALMPIN
jgi:hypothetical protein